MPDNYTGPVTAEIVRQRAALAGIEIDEERLDDVVQTLDGALRPLRALDIRGMRRVEPAVTYDAQPPG